MANYNEEDVQWLYDRMVGDGVDAGTIDDFKESLKSDIDRDWYHKRAKKMGLDVGDADEFKSWTVPDEVDDEAPANGTVIDQAVDNMNRMTGSIPQEVQDMAFTGQQSMHGQTLAEKENPQIFQKPEADPEPWKAEGLTKEEYEDIAWIRQANAPTNLAVDEQGRYRANRVGTTGVAEAEPQHTYQAKESWGDDYSRKASKYGQLRYGWRRGQRYRQLNMDGVYLGGYVAYTDKDAAAQAEQMSDQQLIEAYNKLSQQINKNYVGGISGFASTPEGKQLAGQLNAIGKELHFRDLGYEHTSSVPGRGDVDYRSIMTEPDVAEEAQRLSNIGNRDAEVAQLYLEGMTNGNMETAERAMLASAALYARDNDTDIDTAYAMVEANAFNTAMRDPLQADVDTIYNEEKAVQSQKQTEAISGMATPTNAGDAMAQQLAMRSAAPTREMLNTMTSRGMKESAAVRAYYGIKLREHMRGGTMDIMHARAAAMNDVRNLFRDIEVAKATPDSSFGIIANAFTMENLPMQVVRGLANFTTKDYEYDEVYDEGMARAKANADVMTNVLAGVAPFVADSALGSFKIPGMVGKAVSTGTTKLATWSLNRVFGLGEEAMARRLGGNWIYRTVTGALSGSANFGTYMGMSAAAQGFRQGNASWGTTWEGAKHGMFDGLVFGGTNGTMSKIIESAKGGWAIAAEAGSLVTEAGVFTALDYMRTGEITAESIGQSLGMVIASRAMNFREWASDVAARAIGTKWQRQVKGPVRWSKETREALENKYPTLCRLMGGDTLAADLVKGATGKANRKTGNLKEVDAFQTANDIEREWNEMQNDPTVDFAAKRMANYVLNGQLIPKPAVCNYRITKKFVAEGVDEDGADIGTEHTYGETLDINGDVIERFELKNDDERLRFEEGVALDAERNRIGIEQAAWSAREVEPVIAGAIDAVASAHGMDAEELAKAYFTADRKIKGSAMRAAAREVEALVNAEMRTKTNHQAAVEAKYNVDLEEVVKTPIKERTEAEQQALDEYELRLTDRYDESQDKSTAELIQDEQQQSHDDGYQAEGDQLADVKERLEDAADALAEMRIDPRQFDGMTEQQISDWLESRGNNEEEIDAVLEYLNAKAAFEGVKDKVNDVSAERIEQTNKETDGRTNKKSGQIHRVTLKPESENEPGREAFVVDGKITVNEDGTIDRENSDKEVVISYGDGSEPEMRPIEDVVSGEQPTDPEQLKQEAADGIVAEETEKVASQMNRTLTFNEGDTFTVLAEGRPFELTVVGVEPDTGNPIVQDAQGRRMPINPDVAQQMHDEWREWVKNGGQAAVDNGEVRMDNESAPAPGDQHGNAAPVDERPTEGKPAAPGTDRDPQERVAYYRASGKSEERIEKEIANNLAAARERLEKAKKAWDESKETDETKLDELEREAADARRDVEYWEEVDHIRKATREPENAVAEQPIEPVADNEMQPIEEPTAEIGGTAEEYKGPGMSPELRERMDDGTGIVNLIDGIARQLGLQVREFDGPSYMPGYIEDGIIWINRNREEGTRDTYRFTLGHELTHGLKEEALRLNRPDLYEALKDAALNLVRQREGSGFDAYVRNLTRRYQNAHYMDGYAKAIAAGMSEADAVKAGNEQAGRVSREFIEEEMVCDTIGDLMSGDVEGAQRMMQQVEDKSLIQRFKDYIVNLLTKMRDAFSPGSKEYNELDETIAKWNDMYNEVMKEREEIQRGLESTIEDDAGNAVGKRASVSSTFEGMGFKFFDDELGEDGKRQAMEDEEGNLYVTLNGRKFDKDNHVTIEDVADVECPMNWMLRSGLEAGKITPIQQYRIQGNYVKLLNLFLDMGASKNGGVSNLEDNYQLLGETVFRSISPNGDKQYTVSADITRICKKNEAVINTISELQRRQGYGATPAQILDIYLTTHEEGYQVPCPVCYVFSRYIRNGKFASSAINGMEMYGQHLPGGSDPWSVDRWVDELKKLGGLKDEGDDGGEKNEGSKMFKDMSKAANDAITRNLNLIDELGVKLANEMNKPKPDKAKVRQLEKDIRRLAEEYKKATDVFNQMSQTNWIKTFAIRKTKNGWIMWEDAKLPENMEEFKEHALDLRLTASTIENYPAIQRLRRSGGSASGKEVTQASNNEIGETIMGIGQKGVTKYNNYYTQAMEATDPIERDRLLKEAQKKFDNAVEFAAKQNLRGGQRMWSWSDNIERLSPDVISNLMQLEILGAGLQSYSKQLEGVEMVARMNGYVNGSLMGKDDGYREVDESMFDKATMRLNKDIVDIIYDTRLKQDRDQIVAGEGAMVHEVDGKYYVLIYDDVLGISAHGRKDVDGNKVKMGLFDLNGQYNRAGNILVTMNDLHSKLALADDRVHFIIPWHSSGANSHVLAQMLNVLGQHIDTKSVDYTAMQEEKDMASAKKAIPKHLHELWDKARQHAEEKGWACGIGNIDSNGDTLTKSQVRYRELRDAIMDGTVKAGSKEYKAIMADEFLRQTYEAVQDAGGKMTTDDKKYIYPYEYWIKTETDAEGNVVPASIKNADENGWRYMEYCRRLGRRPKFSGKYDGEKWSAAGDFTESKGCWKTLIDRRMYDLDGNFQDMTPIDSSGFDTDLVDRKVTAAKYDVTTVADDEGVNRIVDIVQDTERTRIGEYAPKYGQGQNKAAKAMKPAVVTGNEKKEMIARYNDEAKKSIAKSSKKLSVADVSMEDIEDGDATPRFSIVRDPFEKAMVESELERDRRETGEYEVRYRAMLLMDDGYHQPMATRDKGKLREALHDGDIERSDEIDFSQVITPEIEEQIKALDESDKLGDVVIIPDKLRYHKGAEGGVFQFYLVKDNKKSSQWVAYNPYLHMSDTPLNDQFKSAWDRPNMVVVRVLIPRSELSVGEDGRALHAKDHPGNIPWNSGSVNKQLPDEQKRTVTLSRYCKIDGIVPVEEAVGMYVDKLLDNDVEVPFNCVTPAERDELYRRGVRIGEPQKNTGKACRVAYESWKNEHPDNPGGGVRFSLSETHTDDQGREVYTERRNDGTLDREVVTNQDGSKMVTWFDEAGRKKEVLSYYPNGEVRQVSNYGSEGDLTRQIQYDENRRAIRHWEPRIGTDWKRDENGVARGRSNGVEMVRYSLAPTFYSNAAKAVEGVKQEKAKAEQWKAMLTKAGGIKAGEDKWMGLSTWLDEHKGETLTKDEVRQFVAENGIEMEETHYGDVMNLPQQKALESLQNELDDIAERKLKEQPLEPNDAIIAEAYEMAWEEMIENHGGDDFNMAFEMEQMPDGTFTLQPTMDWNDEISDAAKYFLGIDGSETSPEPINTTRLGYTTPGLKNKREIAFVVPDVEPYQENDEIHFGPENQGRAVMWVRFGETRDTDGNRVLVIDEIQSNRHQEAREKGYKVDENTAYTEYKKAIADYKDAERRGDTAAMREAEKRYELYGAISGQLPGSRESYQGILKGAVPAAPFEKNWHEVAMKRMLRLAAEEGFDKVAWTTGEQQASRYNLGSIIDSIEVSRWGESYEGYLESKDERGVFLNVGNGDNIAIVVNREGIITEDIGSFGLKGKSLSEVVGKELAQKIMSSESSTKIDGGDLRIGGEGMRAFYDGMLPQFMNKYGKRWGVKVGEMTLDTPGKEVMHSVDVNEDMKRSVMHGQPLFSLSAEQQERQTHSENFKNWFGDWENDPEHASKVVDKKGRPKVVYHGTLNSFTSFMRGDIGFHFGDKSTARNRVGRRGIIMGVYLDIKNPIKIDEDFGTWEAGYQFGVGRYLFEHGIISADELDKVLYSEKGYKLADHIQNKNLRELLLSKGYDGIIYNNTFEANNKPSYIVFRPEQIKSATDNNGDFSRENPDIRFSLSLGAPYQGSKGKIAKDIVDILPRGERFVDLFSGGGAVTHAAMLSDKYGSFHMNDINPVGQRGFVGGINGEWDNYDREINTPEEFDKVRGTMEGIIHSHSYYGRNVARDGGAHARAGVSRMKSLGTLEPYADRLSTTETDYREVELRPGDVVYADIPYENTDKRGYGESRFDKGEFVEWAQAQDVPVFVSEYTMPEGWTEIGSFTVRGARGGHREEKLWVQDKFAGDYGGRATAHETNTEGPRFQLADDVEPWQSEQVSWERSALDHLLQNAADNEENKSLRSQAVQAVNSTLADLLRRISQTTDRSAYNSVEATNVFTGAVDNAMSAQRRYDRWTVDSLVSMAKSMLKSGLYDGLSPYEVNRLIGKINEGAGREEIQEQMNTVFDVLMKANLRGWENQLKKLTSLKDVRINQQGVRVMGQVDKMGSVMLRSMRSGMELSQEDLERKMAEVSDRLASDNSIDAHDAENEMEGLILAQQYNDLIGKYDTDNKAIKDQVREQLEKIYDFWREPNRDADGNIIYRKDGLMSTTEKRRLKPEFGGLDENGVRQSMTDEAKRIRQQVERTVASLEGARRENQVHMSEGYAQLTDALGGGIAAAVTRAKQFRENEKLRKQEIYHAANSDLLNVDNTTQEMDLSNESSAANNGILRFFLNPMQTFDKMLRYFGMRSANGEGRLFNRFMRGQAECSHNEWNSFKAGLDEMDAKADELFGMRWMKLGNAMRDGKKFPPIQVSYWDNNNYVTSDLRQDEAVYLYCVNKMRDGRMKLEAMGIDDNVIQQIVQQLDPNLVKLADWYQGEFLPKRRDYYNQVYERMFGTPMARVENYIHLNINEKNVAQNKELGDRMAGENSPSTITGSLKERKTNVTPIKLHTSLLDMAMQEHQKMEHWAAWGEFNRDLKDLINYGNFRAKVQNLKSKEFGSGEDLMRAFEKCAAIVTGDYQPAGRKSGIDTYAANWAKFVATAKIAFRPFTALKQTLSFPAFMSEARPDDLLWATMNPKGSVEWAMKNLPGFAKRWQSRQAGDTRLMETDSDWNVWRNSTVQKLGRAGLWMNAGVDCLTVAVGARGVYSTAKRRYLSYGYSEAQAEKKALEDASIAYNASQQSSEGAFTSAQQTDRTIMSIATTCFRNASMGYERRFTTAVRNLTRMAKKGYREEVIENTAKQMMEEGLTEEQAQRAAERVYNRMKWHSMMDIANFGFVLPFLWNLGPALIYIFGGNDDEQKKELWRDTALHATFGPIEGLTFGGTMSELANIFAGSMLMDGKDFGETMKDLRYRNFTPLPIMSDIQGLYNTFSTDAWAGVNDLVNLLVQAGTGVNPETFTDMGVALIDACNGDLDLAKETGFFMMRVANMPKSQVDKIYMDELGMSSDEGAKMSWEELAQRYAKYNARKDAPLAAALLSDEAEKAREQKYVERFYKRAKEKLEKASDEDLQRVYGQGDEQRKMVAKEVAKRAGLDSDRYSKVPNSNTKPETAKAIETYQRMRGYNDMAEDVLLQKAKADAIQAGDDERADKIEKALAEITKARKGMGVNRNTDERILKDIREKRKQALKELNITK